MAHFIARIQLHAARQADYEHLHVEMEKESFTITRKYRTSRTHAILNAEEYKCKGDTLKDINNAIFRAARKTGKACSFTVMKETRS